MPIALDVMGGDNLPQVRLEAAKQAIKEDNIPLLLVGDEQLIKNYLDKNKLPSSLVEIVPSTQCVEMTDSPIDVVRKKKNSSMRVCFDLHKSKQASALVSAGNSGAMLAHSVILLKPYPYIERPCFSVFAPKEQYDLPFLLSDAGANVDCTSKQLIQFAILSSLYLKTLHNRVKPKVALLNIGSEENKGKHVIKETYKKLMALNQKTDIFTFVGNLEGKEVFSSDIDVLLTDGFAGNVFLKSIQGAVKFFYYALKKEVSEGSIRDKIAAALSKPMYKRLSKHLDYSNFSGAPILGVHGHAFVCHGSSNTKAIHVALKVAKWAEEKNLSECMLETLANIDKENLLC